MRTATPSSSSSSPARRSTSRTAGRSEMRLELRWSRVEAVTAASTTRLDGTRLQIDLEAPRAMLARDARLDRLRLDLVHPRERCPIGPGVDVVAPRAKPRGARPIQGTKFPGALREL